jgi:diguanylate cyclase (GGDEF)-like protein
VSSDQQPAVFKDRPYVDGQEPCMFAAAEPSPSPPPRVPKLDAAEIFSSIGEVPYEWRLDTDGLLWGRNAGRVLMLRDMDAVSTGRGFAQLLDSESRHSRTDAVTKSTLRDEGDGVPYQLQYCLRAGHHGEKKLWVEDTGRWFGGPDGKPARAHGVVRAINERYEREQRLTYLSQFDELTGQMNHWQLTQVLASTVEEAIRFRSSCGFLLVSIDHLGRFNDAYGFEIANEVIRTVAKRLQAKLRGADCLGRYSGNKFGVILKNCTPDDLAVAAERLISGLRDDLVQTGVGPLPVSVTVGGVNAPRHARNVPEIVSRTHEALERAKSKRRGSFLAYRPSVEREAARRDNVRATDDIITALNQRRVLLAYEPVIATGSRQPAFYECLMRIRTNDGQLLATQEVVPIAERLGLVPLLDHRVVELVVHELVMAPALRASLNVSPDSTIDPGWWDALVGLLRTHTGAAERLTVEITETAAIQDVDETRGFVTRVKDLGCRIAIDDFGAGHTSFRNLRKLGVDLVKIDGTFVHNMLRSQDDRAFVQTLIELAHRLGLAAVAEWVQDEKAATMLSGWGCDYLQGALVGLADTVRPWSTDIELKTSA